MRTKQTQLLHTNSISNKACTLTTNCFTNAEQKPVLALSLFNFDDFSTLNWSRGAKLWLVAMWRHTVIDDSVTDKYLKTIETPPPSWVPAVTQTLNLTSVRIWYGKVTFGNKFSSSLKMFIVKGNKIQLGFDNKCAENNQLVRKSIYSFYCVTIESTLFSLLMDRNDSTFISFTFTDSTFIT